MAKDNNLTDFVTDIANTIRSKDGTSATIDPQDFSSRIINYQAKTVNSSTSAQTVTADSGYMALSSVKVNAMATGTATVQNRTSGGTAVGYGKEVSLTAGYYSATKFYTNVASGSATGNAGTITYKSIAQDSSNKKKFTITGTVTAPAPTVSAGYVSSGTAGTSTDRTVAITLTDAQAQAAVGSASVSAYFDDGNSLNTYFNAGTTEDYDAAFTYGDTVSTAGYTSSNHRLSKFYKIKTGVVSSPTSISGSSATVGVSGTSTITVSLSKTISVTPNVSTTGWIAAGTATDVSISLSGTLTKGAITNNTTLPSGSSSSGTINRGSYIKIAAGYYTSTLYYYAQSVSNGTITNNTSGGTSSGTINVGKQIKIGAGYYASDTYYTAQTAADGASGDVTCNAASGNNVAGYATASVKSGSATTPATSITANPGTPTWNSTNSNYVISVSATKSVIPTISAGWVASGTAGTITVSGSSTLAQSTWATGTVPSGTTPTTLAKNTSYKLAAGYYPSDRYYQTQADPSLSGDAGAANVLTGKTFYSNSYTKTTGTMTNNGAISATKNPTFSGATASYTYTVPAGYHNGSGTVSGSVTMSNGSVTPNIYSPNIGTYFSAGTSSDNNVIIVPQYTSSAGYIATNSSAVSGTNTYWKIKTGSATTPTASGASTSTSLSGTTLTVARSVTPTVSTGWVSSGTAGTVTITGTVPTQTKSVNPTGTAQSITPDSGKLLSSVTVGASQAQGVSKHSHFTSSNRLVYGNSAYASSVDITGFSALSTSKTYNIIIVLGGYGWSSSGTNISSGVLTLFNVSGGSMPSSVAASKTYSASGFGGSSYQGGTFTLTAGMYNTSTLRISVSVSGLSNAYAGAAYVDVKMVIFQEV